MQQRFDTQSQLGRSADIVFYGNELYLHESMGQFVYDGIRYSLKYLYTVIGTQTMQCVAREARKGATNVNYRKHHYSASNQFATYDFVVVQTNDVNTYLHDKYEFKYAMFRNMKFEMVFPDEAEF